MRIKDKKKAMATIQQMVADKREIQAYIREHGTLNGFKHDRIKLVRPF